MKEILGAPYTGRKAAGYDTKRKLKKKWLDENKFVGDVLMDAAMRDYGLQPTLLDVAVGTGRFLPTYDKIGYSATGIDISEDMLKLAAKRSKKTKLTTGNAVRLEFAARKFNTVVCVRLLHLVKESVMRIMLGEICRVARNDIILTIQLGKTFRAGHDTATHNENKFRRLLGKLGWRVLSERKLTGAGWYIMHLVKESAREAKARLAGKQ